MGLWGGISLGVGIVAVALFSQTTGACNTNVIVLANARIALQSCAAYSICAHIGVGLMVLGALLIVGAFILSLSVAEPPITDDERVGELPPGWFGDPTDPDRPVQWWDGKRLVDRPPPRDG